MMNGSDNPKSTNGAQLNQATTREVVSLLSQLVTSTDLLRVEARGADCGELSHLLSRAGTLALEAARHSDQTLMSGETIARLRSSIEEIFATLQEIQHAAALVTHQIRIGQELLDLELTTLRLSNLIDPNRTLNISGPTPTSAIFADQPRCRVLIVDDDEANRDILVRLLRTEPYELLLASSGNETLDILQQQTIDLLLLDVLMPGMDGITVLRILRDYSRCADLPVIMLSGVDELSSVITSLELGAQDYVSKPFHPVLLKARLRSALEHRRLILNAKTQTRELNTVLNSLRETHNTDQARLRNILPAKAAEEFLSCGSVTPSYHDDVTIVFTDFVQFTSLCSSLSAYELVAALNDYFTAFDSVVKTFGLERLKTVGDSYIYISGLTERTPSHPIDAVLAAMKMLAFVNERSRELPCWGMRVGINTGPVISGVVGTERPAFDVWGDTVNLASRMVTASADGKINISEKTFQRVKEFFVCEHRGSVAIKGNRSAEMFFVNGPHASMLTPEAEQRPQAFRARYRTYFQREVTELPAALFCCG